MTTLVRYDAMCRAIAEAHAVDEVKDIRDKALALAALDIRGRDLALAAVKVATHFPSYLFPSASGVYVFVGMEGYLYVGESTNLRKRLTHHERGHLRRSAGVRCLIIPCRNHKRVERWLIDELKPSLNGVSEFMSHARGRPGAHKSFDEMCAELDWIFEATPRRGRETA